MKCWLLIISMLSTPLFLSGCSSTPTPDKRNIQVAAYPVKSVILTNDNTSAARKILFIGNSILYWHNVPEIFASLMTQVRSKLPTKIAYVVGNNYSLKDHWDSGRALAFVNKMGPWDYVILQDSSGAEFSLNPEEFRYRSAFIAAIRKAKARPLLFQTYVDDPSDESDSEDSFRRIAIADSVSLLPVGKWWNLLRRDPRVELYDVPGGHHPSLLGSYLIALVTILTIENKIPSDVLKNLKYSDSKGAEQVQTELVNDVMSNNLKGIVIRH